MSEEIKNETLPEELPAEEEKPEYIPSPRWKRVLAWVLFAVVVVGIALWLLGIARPEWPDALRSWLNS